jgi:integrase
MERAGGRFSRDCADLVRFLSFGGFRLGEAKNITWKDCDFAREGIVVRGDPEEATKNGEVRRVPMIGEMRQLLERLRGDQSGEPVANSVMRVEGLDSARRQVRVARPVCASANGWKRYSGGSKRWEDSGARATRE